MAFANPSNSNEIFYGTSGDVRDEINAAADPTTTAGHYADEKEIPGKLIVRSLRIATRLINSFLEPVYADQLPFQTVGAVPLYLDEIATDLATYYVFRSASARLGKLTDDQKREYYDTYINMQDGILTRISYKEMQLPELTTVVPLEGKSVRARGRHPVFDINGDLNQGIDPDLERDIEAERNT